MGIGPRRCVAADSLISPWPRIITGTFTEAYCLCIGVVHPGERRHAPDSPVRATLFA